MTRIALLSWWWKHGARRRWLPIGAGILVLSFAVWWYVAAEDRVCLIVDNQASVMRTRAARVTSLLRAAGVTLASGDVVVPAAETAIREGLTVQVYRAFPAMLIVGGETREIRTIARPVGELLGAFHVHLGADDRVLPGLGQEVKPGQTVRVIRVSIQEVNYREEIPPPVVVHKDAGLDQGVRRIVTEGCSGLVERIARIHLEDGVERRRQVLVTRWLRQPLQRVIALGTRPIVHTLVTSRGQVVRYTRVLLMTATGYDPGPESCGVKARGVTRTGARATYGVAAVDPRVIPLGTRLYIEGYGFATALDTGSAIKGNRIDLCFDTYREALMYGKRKVKIFIAAD